MLTQATLLTAVDHLSQTDPDLAEIVARFGPPPLWRANLVSLPLSS